MRSTWACIPTKEISGLVYGCAGVECSISGEFYISFPSVQYICNCYIYRFYRADTLLTGEPISCIHTVDTCCCVAGIIPMIKHTNDHKPIVSITAV
jgi:hypothetical protein